MIRLTPSLAALRRRLDAQALDQLRAVAAAQAEELEALRERCARAEEIAESWRDDALDMQLELCQLRNGHPGITQAGKLVVVQAAAA